MQEPETISIDFIFNTTQPTFGDLFKIVGYDHPNFSSTDNTFLNFSELEITQIDDFFGIENEDNEGDDVILWIFPLINNEEVYRHAGPFDGLRLQYNTLRNTTNKLETFEAVFTNFTKHLNTSIHFDGEIIDSFAAVKNDFDLKTKYWQDQNLEPGSEEALLYEE